MRPQQRVLDRQRAFSKQKQTDALFCREGPFAVMEVKREECACAEKLELHKAVHPYLGVGRCMDVTQPYQSSVCERHSGDSRKHQRALAAEICDHRDAEVELLLDRKAPQS